MVTGKGKAEGRAEQSPPKLYGKYINGQNWQCPNSPSGAHHWVQDSDNPNLWRCKYCEAEMYDQGGFNFMRSENRETHKKLGCHGCRFADRKALRLGKVCCTYPGRVIVEAKGKCKNRKEDKPEPAKVARPKKTPKK